MKYRNIQIGEVIPMDAEIRWIDDGPWERYWNDEIPFVSGIPNVCFPAGWLRVPVEEDEKEGL